MSNNMITLKCPKCGEKVEISDKEVESIQRTAVFCKNEACFFYDHALIGLDRSEPPGVYISEAIV